MNLELELIAKRLEAATTPEELFGKEAPKREYLRLSKVTHPDVYLESAEKALATKAFAKLGELWALAQRRLEAGIYGEEQSLPEPFKVRSKAREYTGVEAYGQGEVCALYCCTYAEGQAVLKVARQPKDNDLVANEARVLRLLHKGREESFRPYVPELLDSFSIREGRTLRQANVVAYGEGFISLEEIKSGFPRGLPAKDMAWIWRRLLIALGFAHRNTVIHGAVLPSHVRVHPLEHGLLLTDWEAAVTEPAGRVRMVSAKYRSWYPEDVFKKDAPAAPGLDIYLAARSMAELLGDAPRPIRAFLNGCTLPGPKQRPVDAWRVLEEFDELIEKLWGRRTYRPLVMPKEATIHG